jgi:prolipoprotein diacylglyceryl transferase
VKSLLASIPSPTVNDFTLGAVVIHFYALFIILGIVLAILVSALRLKSRGGSAGIAVDIAIWAVPFGIIGGRLFHVATHLNDYFGAGKNPVEILYVWNGGLAIYGAIILGAVGAWIGARQSGIRFSAYADALAPGLLLAQGIGRWGNYFNQELFGTPTTAPWGLEISTLNPAWPVGLPEGTLMQPTFLYESIWNILGVVALLLIERKLRLQWGKVFAVYLIIYSLGRSWIEPLRLDPANIFLGIRTNEWSALFGIALGIVLYIVQSRRHTGLETGVYLPGREPEQVEAAADTEVYEGEASVESSDSKTGVDLEKSNDEVNSKSE